MHTYLRLLFLFPTALLAACTTLNFSSPQSVDLSGTWVVDETLSQRVMMRPPRDEARGRGKRGGGRGPGMPPGNGAKPGGPSGGPGGSFDVDDYTASQVLTPAAANSNTLVVEHVPESMGIRYQNGKYRDIDWGKTERGRLDMLAGWQDQHLIVKTKGRRGTITETFSLNASGDTLTIVYGVNDNEFTRVYRLQSDD